MTPLRDPQTDLFSPSPCHPSAYRQGQPRPTSPDGAHPAAGPHTPHGPAAATFAETPPLNPGPAQNPRTNEALLGDPLTDLVATMLAASSREGRALEGAAFDRFAHANRDALRREARQLISTTSEQFEKETGQ